MKPISFCRKTHITLLFPDLDQGHTVDTDSLVIRQFEGEALQRFQQDPDFNYTFQIPPPVSFWDTLKYWVMQFLDWFFGLFGSTATSENTRIFIYIILALAAVIFILLLLRVNINRIFISTSASLPFEVEEENIHQMDFEQLIDEAVQQQQFRKAIRLIYLYALKKLSEKGLIHWIPGKTNQEYAVEIKDPKLLETFNQLSYYFEYTWYGNFNISESLFQKVKSFFTSFNNQLKP